MIEIPISPGELLDKISILEIKRSRLASIEQISHVEKELTLLNNVRLEHLNAEAELSVLMDALKRVNSELWEIEDAIRQCEREGDFGDDFIELARSVYFKNDERSKIKRKINELLDSKIVEEKSYSEY